MNHYESELLKELQKSNRELKESLQFDILPLLREIADNLSYNQTQDTRWKKREMDADKDVQ